jgi:hypothetical protein
MTPDQVFPAIRNWQMQPPQGGWSVTVSFRGYERFLNGSDPHQILSQAKAFARGVGHTPEPWEIESMLNGVWTSRDPGRALPTAVHKPTTEGSRKKAATSPAYHGPALYGAQIWGWLNTFGMIGSFSPSAWKDAIERTSKLLNPTISPQTGCATCFNEWMDILETNRPEWVANEAMAAKWVFDAHNRVNAKLGKKLMPWDSAVRKFGWSTQ